MTGGADDPSAERTGGVQERYHLYIDESGDHVFHDEKTLQEAPHRYLALAGCWFKTSDYVEFHRALEDLKQKHVPHNPDEPVVLHRSDILNRRGPFWRLRDPDKRAAFDGDLLSLIRSVEFKAVVVVIDKLRMRRDYANPFHPYHAALDFLLQRYCCVLNHHNRKGDVTAESRQRHEDRLLRNAYNHILTYGDMHHKASFYQQALTSRKLKLKRKSANIAGLQLADLLAHPLKQQLLIDHGKISDPGENFGTKVASAAARRYNTNVWTGELEGYGRVLFPK